MVEAGRFRRRWGRVRRLPSGRWQARHLEGSRLAAAPGTFSSRALAERWLEVKAGELGLEDLLVPTRPERETVRWWGERWLSAQSHWKPKTRADNESLWKTHVEPAWGDRALRELRPMHVQEWVAEMSTAGMSASRVRKAYGLLSQMMGAAELNELVDRSPCRKVRLPQLPSANPVILTPEQVRRLADVIGSPNDIAVLVLAYAGLRVGELFALRRRHFDALHGRLLIQDNLSEVAGRLYTVTPKNHQQREVTLPPAVALLLAEHCGRLEPDLDVLLFRAPRGGQVRYTGWLHRVWQPAVEAANLSGVTPHDLRATHASWVVDSGGSALDAAARLGHGTASVTTKHYARVVSGRDADVAARMQLPTSD